MATWSELLHPRRGVEEALELALAVVKAYGYTLELSKSAVSSESELVFPKAVIKMSIFAMYSHENSDEKRMALKQAYAMLGSFQSLTAEEITAINMLGPQPSRAQLSDRAAVQEWIDTWPLLKGVIERALMEQHQLSEEFRGVTGQ